MHYVSLLDFKMVKNRIEKLIRDKVVVGHTINYDLECLKLKPSKSIVDISRLQEVITMYETKMSVSVGNSRIGYVFN